MNIARHYLSYSKNPLARRVLFNLCRSGQPYCDFYCPFFCGIRDYRRIYYITLENNWLDPVSVFFHFNMYDPKENLWDVTTRLAYKEDVQAFFKESDIPIENLSGDFFDEDGINQILWNNPLFFSDGDLDDERAIEEVERQKKNYQECIQIEPANPEDVRARLDEMLCEEAKTPFVRSYAVGQANFSALFEESESKSPIGVFDLGIIENKKVLIPMVASNFSNKGFVLLSHFDCDHINGCQLLPPNSPIFQRLWISHFPPKVPKQGVALPVFSCVPKNRWLFLLPGASVPCRHLDIDVAQMFDPATGKKLDPFQKRAENGTSAVALIKYHRSMLLPGDALYGNFLRQYSPDYCLIPHHSCGYPVPIPSSKMDCSKVSVAFIPVSFTGQTHHRHPKIEHFNQYNEVHRFVDPSGESPSYGAVYFDSYGLSFSDTITKKELGLSYDFPL